MRLPRLYPILDTASLERRGWEDWTLAAKAMLDGGAEILQIRHKGEWTRRAFAQAAAICEACRAHNAVPVINDRADIAALCGAALHLGQDDLAPADCRAVVGAGAVVGFSTHNAAQLEAALSEPVDYLVFGPVYATASKAHPDPVVGIEGFRRARAITERPLAAIGGITRSTARELLDAGADSLAIISDLLPDVLSSAALRGRMEEWRRLIHK